MKLSELIAFRNRLEKLPVSAAKQAADHKLNILMHTVHHPHEQSMVQLTQPFIPALEAKLKEIHAAFDNFSISVDQIKKHIQDQIVEQEKHWFQESYRLFEGAELCEKTDQILYGRTVTGTKSLRTIESEDMLRARLSSYADWRWPGMIIRPGLENFIETMVGSDPLYIIDRGHDLLQPCLDRFPQMYQNRLRSYTTNDWSDQPILGKIPNNQFGVCLAYNVFNYRPLEIIRRYLEEIYTKLRPGGVLLMTYNDCDQESAVMLVEQFCTSYTPGYLIRELTQNVGFELAHTWSDGGPSVWLELHKPGQLIGNRGGQALAKIHNIFDYSDDIDFLKRKAYTKDEIVKLQNQANDLGINKKIIKRSEPYDLQVLITTMMHVQYEADRIENEKKQLEMLQRLAEIHNIDMTAVDWKNTLHEIMRVKEEEELRIAQELHEELAKSVDQRKREELVRLRQRAMELQAGDPNLIRYGYSSEKLKNLIKQKEEENK
jgi:SAM-dependent methyltransferase